MTSPGTDVIITEAQVIGASLRSETALAECVDILKPALFLSSKHRVIWQCISDMFAAGDPVDITTVAGRLDRTGQLRTAGGRVFLVDCLESVFSVSPAAEYARIVLDAGLRRRLVDGLSEVLRSNNETPDLIEQAEKVIYEASEGRHKSDFVRLSEVLPTVYEHMESVRSGEFAKSVVLTDFIDLDQQLGGLNRGELIVVAGRPSMGKSALAANIAENVARHGGGVAFFSLEMSAASIVQRIICGRAKVNPRGLGKGGLTDDDWDRLAQAGRDMEIPLFIDDTGGLSCLALKSRVRRLKTELSLIVVDYLQIMTPPRAENRQNEVAALSRELKALAKEMNVPVICISQLSRRVEERDKKRPVLADLRDSGAIEQDADVVLFVYRPEYYNEQDSPGMAEVIISKHRNGPTGSVNLVFRKEYARFENSYKEEK